MTAPFVWVDFGGVLTSPIAAAWQALVERTGLPGPVLRQAIDAVAADFGMELLEPLERGAVSQARWGRLVTAALAPRTCALDLTCWAEYWYRGREINHELLDALAGLRDRGVRLGLLTNSVAEWEPQRQALLPDTGLFDLQIKSHEIGLRKPDPEIYVLAEERAGSPPGCCLLVDDAPVNCVAARARGWSAVHHTSTTGTVSALTDFLSVNGHRIRRDQKTPNPPDRAPEQSGDAFR